MTIKLNINSKIIKVKPKIGLYHVYDFEGRKMYGLAISLYCNEQPHAKGYLDPFTTITKSFGEYIFDNDVAYVDLNNCPFASQFLDLGYAEETLFDKQRGFCIYPLWKFKKGFLKRCMGQKEYRKYLKANRQYKKDPINFGGVM